MIVRYLDTVRTTKTKSDKFINHCNVDDGKDSDPYMLKIFSDEKLSLTAESLIVVNPSDDYKLFFYRSEYEKRQQTQPKAVNS